MCENRTLEECVSFFKKNAAYDRLFKEMGRKYRKYGKLTGKLSLEGLSGEEALALGRVLGETVPPGDQKIPVSRLQAALGETRYRGVELKELLFAYFGGTLVTDSQRREKDRKEKEQFWAKLADSAETEFGQTAEAVRWVKAAAEQKKYGWQLIRKEWEKSPKQIRETVLFVCRALELLPEKKEQGGIRLAMLGAEITKNPHYFDRQQTAGRLLLLALGFLLEVEEPKTQEEVLTLYYQAGIRPDDISSFTVCFGIHLYTENGEHEAYRHFIEMGEKYVLTLSNLNRIVEAKSRDGRVFILENQMVFSQLCERLNGREEAREYALVCTSGQMKTASLILIDLLVASGCRLYYCGDIDPEGMEIADRIVARAPGRIFLWRMTEEDYYRSISHETLPEVRLKKLDKIGNKELRELAEVVRREKKAGYQEHLMELLFCDILEKGLDAGICRIMV